MPYTNRKEYSAALLLFIVLFIRFLVQLRGNDATPAEKGQEFMDILIVAVTVIVVAIPGMEDISFDPKQNSLTTFKRASHLQ